ncbi:MAG: NAD(P)H-dependent oxidoreductase [Candidatus Obscuribacterales bacterium]|nr:NAD(P)H-dependent oxidoreductase [Cyanobacteria bacterium SZAS LIN-5]
MKSEYLVISCSLNPESNSRKMALSAFEILNQRGGAEWLDLREYELPLCDGGSAYSHKNVEVVAQKIRDAKCILLGVPIYNFDVNAAAKNLIELTGRAWTEKVVGFLCAAGGKSSYMSVMSLGNSLMLDFRSLIIPRFVYADGSSFDDNAVSDALVKTRIEELVETAIGLTHQVSEQANRANPTSKSM